jgi:hypothetical protein
MSQHRHRKDKVKRYCKQDGNNGVLDAAHIEYRLDVIDSRLDDIAAMIAEVFEQRESEDEST